MSDDSSDRGVQVPSPGGLSRRRALHFAGISFLGAAAATLVDVGVATERADARQRQARQRAAAATHAGDALRQTGPREVKPPSWARIWHHPIYTLDDFTHRDAHVHYARKAIMLTIDDGPNAEWTPKYLRLLAKYRVQATFCMIGSQVHHNRRLARAVHEHGHVIANHTWDHDEQLTYGSTAHIRSEIERTQHVIHAATGYTPNQFRNPGGVWGHAVYNELARMHLMPLGWSIDPRDWARPGTSAIERAMRKVRNHEIILCHDGGGNRSETYHALESVIPALLRRGFVFTTLPRA